MTPESAAAFLRSQADAILATGEPVLLKLEVRPVYEPRQPLSSAERSARQRARERLENGTAPIGKAALLPLGDLKEGGSGSGKKVAKELERAADPEESKQATTSLVSMRAAADGTTRAPVSVRPWRRVPSDWAIKPDHRSLALGLLVDVEVEAEKFRDHEFANPKRDADATFRNWIRTAAKTPRPMPQRQVNGHVAVFERARRIQAEEAAKSRIIETNGVAK